MFDEDIENEDSPLSMVDEDEETPQVAGLTQLSTEQFAPDEGYRLLMEQARKASEREQQLFEAELARIEAAKQRLLAKPEKLTGRERLDMILESLSRRPTSTSDPRFFERKNIGTILRDIGEAGTAAKAEERKRTEERAAGLDELEQLKAKFLLPKAAQQAQQARQELIREEQRRARAAQPRSTGTSEFERLTAALQSDIPEEQKKLIRQRIRMLTERPTAAKDESDLPTGQLGQYVQARRILADPEASPADKEAAEAFIANSNKGKLSKANETQKAMLGNIESSFINIFDTLSKAEKIIDENPQSVTGVAAYLSYIPATDARTLSNYIQTIKANIGFDELQKMRMASPTGGALGQVAVQELQFLQSKIATLDQFADREVLLDQLAQIRASYNRWRDTVQQFYDEADAGLGEGETPTSAPGIDLDAAQKALERKRAARGAQ